MVRAPAYHQGPVSRKSRELFGSEKLVVKLQSACFEKMIFSHVFNIRKIKRIAKFEGLEPRRCEDIKGIVSPERDSKSFGTFEKQAPGFDSRTRRHMWVEFVLFLAPRGFSPGTGVFPSP